MHDGCGRCTSERRRLASVSEHGERHDTTGSVFRNGTEKLNGSQSVPARAAEQLAIAGRRSDGNRACGEGQGRASDATTGWTGLRDTQVRAESKTQDEAAKAEALCDMSHCAKHSVRKGERQGRRGRPRSQAGPEERSGGFEVARGSGREAAN
ncbi:hypothetical protein L1887_56949 [Cichorium endivia]|nr:hypothetical protein L1887_56949 [Cichorium endivia]